MQSQYFWGQELSEHDWLRWLLGENKIPGKMPPEMPNDQLQSTFVGCSGYAALYEAQKFLNHISSSTVLPSSPAVLDFACGWGRLYRVMLRWGWSITGVDSEPSMIELCRKSLPGRFELINTSPPYPFAAATFNLAYAYSLFSHVPEHVALKILTEFSRLLSNDGYVAITLLEKSEALRVWSQSLPDFDPSDFERRSGLGEPMYLPTGGGYDSMPTTDYGWSYLSNETIDRWMMDLMLRGCKFDIVSRSKVEGVPQDILILRKR